MSCARHAWKRPGMYIGTTGSKGMHHILWEIIDNCVDEVANGFGDTVTIELLDGNIARVSDNGRGIPVDKHPKLKISGVEVVYTQLHAGAKFDNGQYAYSGGLHGVGASVTNALSEWLTVEVKRDGHLYRAEFHSPQIGGKIKSGVVKTPLTLVTSLSRRVPFAADRRQDQERCRQDPAHPRGQDQGEGHHRHFQARRESVRQRGIQV